MSTNRAVRWLKGIGIALSAVMVLLVVAGLVLYRQMLQPNENIGAIVSSADRNAESKRLRAMGVVLSEDGLVLEQPFAAPYSSRSFVVPVTWWPQGFRAWIRSRQDVRADKLLLDLDILEAAMSRNYGGWESAERAGWNWTTWFADWRAMLRNAGTRELPVDEAFAPMDRYAAFRTDNHTNIPIGRLTTSSFSQSARMANAASAPCTEVEAEGRTVALNVHDAAEQPRVAVTPNADWSALDTAHYVSLPSRMGKLRRIHCGADWIHLEGGRVRTTSLISIIRATRPRAILTERLSDDAVYLRLPTFEEANYANARHVLASAPKPNGHETVLVIDLRDNGGGGAVLAHPFLKPWLDLSRLPPLAEMRQRLVTSCLYPAFRWNQFRTSLRRNAFPGIRDQRLQSVIDTLMLPSPEGCPREVSRASGTITYSRRGVRPALAPLRILVWVNGGCASDCEFLLAQLATLPETVIVGTNSGGVMQFIQPGTAILPNTRLPFRMALGESDVYGDGRTVDGHGLDVDVLLPDEDRWKPADLVRLASLLRPR